MDYVTYILGYVYLNSDLLKNLGENCQINI